MGLLSEIKRSLTSFLLDETGDIPKESLVCLGAIAVGSVIASAAHSSSPDIEFLASQQQEKGTHSSAHSSCAHSSCGGHSNCGSAHDSYGAGWSGDSHSNCSGHSDWSF